MFTNIIGSILYTIDNTKTFCILEDDINEFTFANNLNKIKSNLTQDIPNPNFIKVGIIKNIFCYVQTHYTNSTIITKVKDISYHNLILIINLDNGKHIKVTDIFNCKITTTNKKYIGFLGMYLEDNLLISKSLYNKYVKHKPIYYIEKYNINVYRKKGVSVALYCEYPINSSFFIITVNNIFNKDYSLGNMKSIFDVKQYITRNLEKEIIESIKIEIQKYFDKIFNLNNRFLKSI